MVVVVRSGRAAVWLGLGIWGLVVLFREYGGRYHIGLDGVSRRLVVNCFPYNGERHTLNLKLAVVHPYVDY